MRIVIIHDYRPDPSIGGAEQNMIAWVSEAERQGHTVDWYGYERHEKGMQFEAPGCDSIDADMLLLGSITLLDPRWVNRLVERHAGKIVAWCHDYPWCGYRLGACGGRHQIQHDKCKMGWYGFLYAAAQRVFCYSPDHAIAIDAAFGERVEIGILPIFCDNANLFFAANGVVERVKNRVAVVGRMSQAKGGRNVYMAAKRNPGLTFAIYGNMPPEIRNMLESVDNIELMGTVAHSALPLAYAACQYFFHQPEVLDTGPRTVVEARLAGCELLTSSNLGYLGHAQWKQTDEELMRSCMQAMPEALNMMIEEVATC